MKNNRGEVTINLIIIVVVLIVLAGVCIFMLTGDSGLFVPKSEQNSLDGQNNVNVSNPSNETNSLQNNALVTEMTE